MGNSRSASFEIDHPPEEGTSSRQTKTQQLSLNYGENEMDHLKPYSAPPPHSMYADVYAESENSVSENSSKESETLSTLSSTSTSDNLPSLADRYKTAPSRISISLDAGEEGIETDARKTRSMYHNASPESFFDAIFATIEHEAGKKSPEPPRRRAQSNMAKKRWSSMFS